MCLSLCPAQQVAGRDVSRPHLRKCWPSLEAAAEGPCALGHYEGLSPPLDHCWLCGLVALNCYYFNLPWRALGR